MAFHSIDGANDFARHQKAIQQLDTEAFAVQFSSDEAECALHVTADEVSRLLRDRRQSQADTCLWINLWGWGAKNEDIVKVLAQHYNITPRLAHTICPRFHGSKVSALAQMSALDVVGGSSSEILEKTEFPKVSYSKSSEQQHGPTSRIPTSIGGIARSLWHYCAVDYGRSYICLSWNALFFTADVSGVTDPGKPAAVRIWSSILICDDGTVLSSFECPTHLSPQAQLAVRKNQLNIFSHLSKHAVLNADRENALMQINIRSFSSSAKRERSTEASEMASSLFYYLLDDWISIYYQSIGGETSYRHKLQVLRQEMEKFANVKQVTMLHNIGRELSVLRAVYRSYQSVIERLLQKHRRHGLQRPRLSIHNQAHRRG